MLKLIEYLISIFLISIIFLRMPEENAGLASFTTQTDVLGSPRSARRILNFITGLGIIVYFGVAIKLNLL